MRNSRKKKSQELQVRHNHFRVFRVFRGCHVSRSDRTCARFFIGYLSILICHWKAGVVSQANELEDRLIDLMKTQWVEELIDENQQLCRILNISENSQRKTETMKMEVYFSMTNDD